MLNNQGQAASLVTILAAGSKADTAAATGSWIDARSYEGDLVFIVSAGTVTAGSAAMVMQDATDGSGTGAATVAFNEGALTNVTTSNDPLDQKRTINANLVRGWIRFVGTVTTGPLELGVVMLATPKNIG